MGGSGVDRDKAFRSPWRSGANQKMRETPHGMKTTLLWKRKARPTPRKRREREKRSIRFENTNFSGSGKRGSSIRIGESNRKKRAPEPVNKEG